MQITVKLFASLREEYGFAHKVVELPVGACVAEVWRSVVAKPPPVNLLCARNHCYADMQAVVNDGDEVGFFPPVNGG